MKTSRKKIVLLGATGSIGQSTLAVLRACSNDLELVGIAADRNVAGLKAIADEFNVKHIALYQESAWKEAKAQTWKLGSQLYCGPEGLLALATLPEADMVVVATVGTYGLAPTLAGLKANKTIALANKEVLVMAGQWVMAEAKARSQKILPLDSEHNALFQCLEGHPVEHVERLILTASGGPFRTWTLEAMQNIRLDMALKHPNWAMGPKVTLDCATLANKGLEIIEAHWLFDMPAEKIDVVVHPQSLVHSMIEFVDGSVLAHLSPPKMTFAIQNSLLYPNRRPAVLEPLRFHEGLSLTFEAPDTVRFPALRLAKQALVQSGAYPAVFNAANEVAIAAFIAGKISFLNIAGIIESTLAHNWNTPHSLEDILEADAQARRLAQSVLKS